MTTLSNSAKSLLEKIISGKSDFKCKWNGEEVGIEILQIDFLKNLAYVRFEKDVTKKVTEFIDQPFSPDIDPPQIMVEKEVTTREEWISI